MKSLVDVDASVSNDGTTLLLGASDGEIVVVEIRNGAIRLRSRFRLFDILSDLPISMMLPGVAFVDDSGREAVLQIDSGMNRNSQLLRVSLSWFSDDTLHVRDRA